MDRAERIAEKLASDWESRAAYQALSGELAPADLAEAYRAQALLQERLAARRGAVAGRKIALSSEAMQEMVGLSQPVAAVFFERDISWSPATVPLSAFRRLGLEFELAVELGRDVPPQDRPHDRDSVRALIAGVRPAFELIEDRGADYGALDAFTLIADNAWCGGVVLGEPVADWQGRDLDALAGTIHQPGHEPERLVTGAAAPLASLAWVLNHASAAGRTVRRGEHVITGSAARTRFPKAGERVRYELDGLAAVEVEVI
ncbi:MAG TPA: fumarylacetoacetate hydrolase family protein [Paracoccaceae bacterium]|nr:fumarylacetoacetate hydrolase family protein [Paracoccaceae bacterium]